MSKNEPGCFPVFIVFAGEDNYPRGGSGDFVEWYYTYEGALERAKKIPFEDAVDWIEIARFSWKTKELGMVTVNDFRIKSLFNIAKWSVPDMWEKWKHGPPRGASNQHLGYLLTCDTGKQIFVSSRRHPIGYCRLAIDR